MKGLPFLMLMLILSGCAAINGKKSHFLAQQKKLNDAVQLIKKDEVGAAVDILTRICSEQSVMGVTDEAMFRLALLQLGSDMDKPKIAKAKQTLKRLEDEYPASPWAAQAKHLDPLLGKMALKIDESLYLKRDLMRLKNLDLELDRKALK